MLITSNRHLAPVAALLVLAACANQPDLATPAMAAQPLSAHATIDESIRTLTARGEETLVRSAGPTPGSTMTTIVSGNADVVLARKNADGTETHRCVGSPAEAEAFAKSPAVQKAVEQ